MRAHVCECNSAGKRCLSSACVSYGSSGTRRPTRRANGGCARLIGWIARQSYSMELPVGDVKRAKIRSFAACSHAIPALNAISQNNDVPILAVRLCQRCIAWLHTTFEING
ncbi:unnamed protein product [Pleuronectes platessa]|uniref:Uncharacterized protein n=1 Tax=Pleuronectes platessa TaxID=8262 RepID=A0A9N7TPL4_PLEPL|nr:unnamed protein product [Pleuronectes platessa]